MVTEGNPGPKNYDADPDALEWARAKIQVYVDKARRFERQSDNPEGWRRVANIMEMWLLPSGQGCVIGPFDRRRSFPEIQALLAEMKKEDPGA